MIIKSFPSFTPLPAARQFSKQIHSQSQQWSKYTGLGITLAQTHTIFQLFWAQRTLEIILLSLFITHYDLINHLRVFLSIIIHKMKDASDRICQAMGASRSYLKDKKFLSVRHRMAQYGRCESPTMSPAMVISCRNMSSWNARILVKFIMAEYSPEMIFQLIISLRKYSAWQPRGTVL